MSRSRCTVCDAPLVAGACPNGHPQRGVRARRRRRQGPLISFLVAVLLAAAAAYGALVWYPVRAAETLMRPSSSEFARAHEAYAATVEAFPASVDPEGIAEAAAGVLNAAEAARNELSSARIALDGRQATSLPVISDRPALRLARVLRDQMLAFYGGALDATADLERVAAYLTEVAPVLPQLDGLLSAVGNPRTRKGIARAVASAGPIAGRFHRDLRRIRPPDELGPLHASLLTIARGIRGDLGELATVRRRGPLLRALLGDLRSRAREFREGFGDAPTRAQEAGLGETLAALDGRADTIADDLATLRDEHDVPGLTVPRA